MKKILAQAIASSGSTIQNYRDAEGNAGSFQESHKVYDRTGEPCVACGTPIRMTRVGGRSSHFCPKCQRKKSPPPPKLKTGADSAIVRPIPLGAPVAQYG